MSILDHTAAPRVALLKPTAVNAILADVRRVQATGASVVSLMRGEPDFRTPEHIADAVVAAVRAGRTGYPDNRGEIALPRGGRRQAGARQRRRLRPGTEILATTGATLGLACALTALIGDGDEVLLPDPIYDAYHSPDRPRRRPLASGARADRQRTASSCRSRRSRPRSPRRRGCCCSTRRGTRSAPCSGATSSRRWPPSSSGATCCSSATRSTRRSCSTGTGTSARPACRPSVRARTVVVNSLSKTYAMPGWRVGYCAAPAPIIQAMFLVLQQSSRGPATFIQDAAAAALTGPQEPALAMQREYAARRAQVIDALRGIPDVRVLPPEGGFFAMVDVRATGRTSNDVRLHLLERARRGRRPRVGLRARRRGHAARVVRERRRQPGARARTAARGTVQPVTLLKVDAVQPLPHADPSRVDAAALERALRAETTAEVRFDAVSRALYATDASVYTARAARRGAAPHARGPGRHRPHLRRASAARSRCAAAARRSAARRSAPASSSTPRSISTRVLEVNVDGTLGARRAGHRPRRAERAAAAARPALRARRLDRQPRHRRRHDGQQLERRAIGASTARPSTTSSSRTSCSPTDRWRTSARSSPEALEAACARRQPRGALLPHRARAGADARRRGRAPLSRRCCAASWATTSTSSRAATGRSTWPS